MACGFTKEELINSIYFIEYKHVIHDEQDLYENSAAATTLLRARTGTLKLNIERRHTNKYTNYEIYKANRNTHIIEFLLFIYHIPLFSSVRSG